MWSGRSCPLSPVRLSKLIYKKDEEPARAPFFTTKTLSPLHRSRNSVSSKEETLPQERNSVLSKQKTLSSRPQQVLPAGKNLRSGGTCCSLAVPQLPPTAPTLSPKTSPHSPHTPQQNPLPDAVLQSTASRPPPSIPSIPSRPAPSSAPGALPPRNG